MGTTPGGAKGTKAFPLKGKSDLIIFQQVNFKQLS